MQRQEEANIENLKEDNNVIEENKNAQRQEVSSKHQSVMNYARSVLWSSELTRIKWDNTINQINRLFQSWNSYFNAKPKIGEDLNKKYEINDSEFNKGKSTISNIWFINYNSEI